MLGLKLIHVSERGQWKQLEYISTSAVNSLILNEIIYFKSIMHRQYLWIDNCMIFHQIVIMVLRYNSATNAPYVNIIWMTWCPGSKAEGIQKRLSGIISKDDDVIVLLGGTNNVPRDDVATCIQRINALVREAQTLNKRAHVIISELPIRFDDVSLNSKVEKINIFIKHICTKSKRMHVMSLNNLFRSHFGRDGLHFSETGRDAFAKAIKRQVKQCTIAQR